MVTRHLSALSLLVLAAFLSTSTASSAHKKACDSLPRGLGHGSWPTACLGSSSGSVCTAVCEDSFNTSPAPTSVCRNGEWSKASDTCRKATMCCGKPDKIMNGAWPEDCRDGSPGAVCTAVCRMDAYSFFNKKGLPVSTCRPDGKWSKPEHPSFCHKQRAQGCLGSPTAVDHSTFNCGPTSATGAVCTATCDQGYMPAEGGAPTATCLAGPKHGVPVMWSAVTGSCKQAGCTGNPPNPANGAFECSSPLPVGQVCAATCDTGFSGEPIATCLPDGTYGPVTGTCKQGCVGNPPNIANGFFTCTFTPIGLSCRGQCLAPYGGMPSATCLDDGSFSPVTGSCED